MSDMATLNEFRNVRLDKLKELRALGVDPFPAATHRDTLVGEVVAEFGKYEGKTVDLTGRLFSLREHGKLAFVDLKDASGKIQLFLKADNLTEANYSQSELTYAELKLLDLGDFIEAKGEVIKTKTGEISVMVTKLRILTKALRPLPSSWDGLSDKETRMRRRYLDTLVNEDVYLRYLRRSKFWQATRQYLIDNKFIEINIPVLEQTTGGADANPFVTHMDALDQDFYLRISHELPLKRLLVAGYEKVFDIGPRFRNENYSDEHLPEHVAMEWYWAYANWEQGMKFTQGLVRSIVDATWGTRKFTFMNGQSVDLGSDEQDWPRVSFVELIEEHYGIDVFKTTVKEIQAKLREHKLQVEKTESIPRGLDKLWKKIRGSLTGPAFLVDIPTFLQPLAKTQRGKPELTEQFNLILGGTEACKAYSELNDPVDQLNRFIEQQSMRDSGDTEAQMLDIDYVEALEYAMPPACGFGFSERLFWMLEGVTAREGVPFPQLRHEVDDVTRSIYPNLKFR